MILVLNPTFLKIKMAPLWVYAPLWKPLDQRNMGRQLASYLMSLCGWMAEQGAWRFGKGPKVAKAYKR